MTDEERQRFARRLRERDAEIERLNGVVDSWVDINNAAGVTLRAQEAEIERLTAHMRALADTSIARDVAGIFKGLWQGSEKECDELRAEIERLKALVKELADELDVLVEARYSGTKGYPSELRRYERDIEPVKRARAALEPKP